MGDICSIVLGNQDFVSDAEKLHGHRREFTQHSVGGDGEPEVWARRKQSHRQGFSTAPVDEILEHIKDDLPKIAKKAGVGSIISKWDEEAL